MRHFILIITAVLLLPVTLGAQGKVVDKSGSRPIWVKKDISPSEYGIDAVILSGTSTVSLDDAKEKIISGLREEVIGKIAGFVVNMSMDGTPDEASAMAKAARTPLARGISADAAIETYWEKRYDRKSDTYTYCVYMLYGINELQIKRAAMDILTESEIF